MIIRSLKIIAGGIAIIIGLALGPVPVIPGWPLVLVGIVLISPKHKEPILKWLNVAKEKIKNFISGKK